MKFINDIIYIIVFTLLLFCVFLLIDTLTNKVYYKYWPSEECAYVVIKGEKQECPENIKGYYFGGYVNGK